MTIASLLAASMESALEEVTICRRAGADAPVHPWHMPDAWPGNVL
jgi:hypothetical protein